VLDNNTAAPTGCAEYRADPAAPDVHPHASAGRTAPPAPDWAAPPTAGRAGPIPPPPDEGPPTSGGWREEAEAKARREAEAEAFEEAVKAPVVSKRGKTRASAGPRPAAADYGDSAPDSPARIAAALLRSRYRLPDGSLTLRRWRGDWYRWVGTHYAPLAEAAAHNLVWEYVERYLVGLNYKEAAAASPNKPAPPPASANCNSVRNVLRALESQTTIDDEIEAGSWIGPPIHGHEASDLLSASNGLVHVPSVVAGLPALHPHTPSLFSLTSLGYDYDPAAPAPTEWLKFLASVWGEDVESIDAVQEVFGALLSPWGRKLQRIYYFVGPVRSGKGTIAAAASRLVGEGSCEGISISGFRSNFGLERLIGKSLAIADDARFTTSDHSSVSERLLTISGGGISYVDRKNKQPWSGRLGLSLILCSNSMPDFPDTGKSLASRFLILRTTESHLGSEDRGLDDRLAAERTGLLNWSLAGLGRLKERGDFREPSSSGSLRDMYEESAGKLTGFLSECCDLGRDYLVDGKQLYDRYVEWSRRAGGDQDVKVSVVNNRRFGIELAASVPWLTRPRPAADASGARPRQYKGIRLKPPVYVAPAGVGPPPAPPTPPPAPEPAPATPREEFF